MTKLIEVALPVEAISAASRRDKDRKVGTIKNVHKWFAPMPTPAWRALLFAAIVDDPGDEAGRAKLIRLIERLVPEDGGAPADDVLDEAKRLICEATGGDIPTVFDPFCGGGSTLVEAQRLGLPAVGSDLNPVPALITRVLIELVPQVASRPPLVGDPNQLGKVAGGQLDGFFADLRHYAERVRARVWDEVGHLYPDPPGGGTVVAWLWARTVTCPNPACRATAPLVSSFWLSKKKGAETWIEPVVLPDRSGVRFEVKGGPGEPPPPTKLGRGGSFRCAICTSTIAEEHVKAEGISEGLGLQVMAVAIDRGGSRAYLAPAASEMTPEPEQPADGFDVDLSDYARWFSSPAYGLTTVADLFTNRQLMTLGAFADAVADVAGWVREDGGDEAYTRAIASVLGLCVGKLAMSSSTQSRWKIDSRNGIGKAEAAFSRHALPMVWDFVEANPFGGAAGDWLGHIKAATDGLRSLPVAPASGRAFAADARHMGEPDHPMLIATDPPYFAQIGYADLSDYFYVWHRRALRDMHPDLYATVATPKADELIAAVHRHDGDRVAAARFFVDGFTQTFRALSAAQRADLPLLIVYAHRQEESPNGGATTAWDAMLAAILNAGLSIAGTWPIHATSSSRQIGQGTNALASYVVLVCRPRATDARIGDRQGYLGALRAELPRAIKRLQETAISAIDLGQATIGPGMAVFSRYSRVIEPDGTSMSVRAALDLIGQVRAEVLDEFVGDPGNETRWAMTWFRDNGFSDAPFDEAEKLFKNTSTSLEGLERSGIVRSGRSRVRLLRWEELPGDWDPAQDRWRSVWETALHLVKRLRGGGEGAAGALLRQVPDDADSVRELAYWIVDKCQFTQAKEVGAFDELITSWPRITELAASTDQGELTLLP